MAQVIVVGGGLAGMSAAHTVVQSGGRVLVIDKSPFCGGNSTKATSGINAAGSRTQRLLKIPDTPEIFEDDTSFSAAEGARPDLIHTLTHESGPAVDWLMDSFGLDLSIIARLAAHSHPRTHRGKERFPGMAITYGLMEKLDEIAAAGDRAQVLNKAKVTELIQKDDGEVVGVVYEKGGKTYKAYGPVIIATGGFGADFSEDSLLAQVSEDFAKMEAWSTTSRAASQSGNQKIPMPNLLTLPTTNGVHCSGDGIKLALKAGSDTFDLHCVQIHPTGIIDPSEPDAKVKFLAAEALRGSGGVLLDAEGNRFCDELGKRDYVSGRMFLHGKPPYRLCLNGKASDLISWHCEHYSGRGLMKKLSGAELAKEMNCSPQKLQATFDKYNKASQNPGTDEFGKKFFEATPVNVDDDFHVCIVSPVIHYAMGGVAGNKDAEVITNKGGSIPGLFAAGEVLGGVHGVNRLGGSSLLDCVVFGRVAGRSATKYLVNQLIEGGGVTGGASASNSGINIKVSPNDKSVTISWDGAASSGASDAPPADDGPAEVDPNTAFYSEGGNDPSQVGAAAGGDKKMYSMEEVAQHTTKDDCWVVLHGKVFAISPFLDDHPGGAKAIMLYAGKDASVEFDMLHKMEIIDKYAMEYYVGDVMAAKL